MSEGSKHGNASGLPIRKVRKIPVMTPTARSQSGCSANTENTNPCPRGQNGLARNRLGNKLKKPILSDFRQNQMASKPMLNSKKKEIEISKSAPDLSSRTVRPKITSSLAALNSLPKISSWESVTKSRKVFNENIKVKPPSRIPTKPVNVSCAKSTNDVQKKSKRIDIAKKAILDKNRTGKTENKRKFGCLESLSVRSKQKMSETDTLSPTNFPYSLSIKNRTEECKKIVKKIMLDKKMVELKEKKKSSSEFEDSIGTFNSDEMADMFLNDSHFRCLESAKGSSELDKSSQRNSSEFDDSICSFFSDQMVLKMSNSSEFLNIAGSKQCFFIDSHPGLSNSEELDNLTPGLSDLSNPLERTPSAEELPMECEVEPETQNTTLAGPESTISARSASPTEELPQESLSSRTPNAPVSIITSITSIMSLDTGYQGDGELSRPESRNTENESRLLKLPIAENGITVKTINFDDGKTMTDSDFFTESDVDVHDDLSAAAAEIGSGKGDRKAQVIDGTLYGGAFIQAHVVVHHANDHNTNVPNQLANRVVLPTNNSNEDMESSGIYSDLEKKPEDVSIREKESASYLGMITEQMRTIQNLALSVAEKRLNHSSGEGIVKSSSGESTTTVQEVVSAVAAPLNDDETPEKSLGDRKEMLAKKSKTPSRNVGSKIKAMINTPAKEPEMRPKTVRKGKWDAVMDKIAQGKEENKYTPLKFRDVKSRVFQNVGPLFNSRRNETDAFSQKMLPSTQLKSRSRRSTRIRSSDSSLVSPKSKQSRTSISPNSSQRSSLSDISLSGNQKSASRAIKKRDCIGSQSNEFASSDATTPLRKLNNNDESLSTANTGTPSNRNLQNGNVVHRTPTGTPLATMKTPTIRKTPVARKVDTVGPTLHRTSSVPFKDSNHNGIVSKSGSAVIINNNNNHQNQNNNNINRVKSAQSIQNKSLKPASRGSNAVHVKNGCLHAAAKDLNKTLMKQLKHNSRAFESLAILFSYCANDLDAFAMPYLKKELETEKNKFVRAQSDIEELQSRLIRAREELNDKELVITELNNDKANLGEQSEHFQKLVEELQNKLDIVTEQKCEAESELMRECESIRCLRRELSNRTDQYENEKDGLVCCLSEAKKENVILKTANREIKEEYDKCLVENQRLVEIISKRQNEVSRFEKENEESARLKLRNGSIDRSPDRISMSSVNVEKNSRTATNSSINPKCLESEVESLRQVLALKTDEVTELRRQELSLRENADRVPKLLSTITMLEGKVEDLQTQLSSQTETVRDLFKSNEHLEEELKSANIQKTRLTHKNEELQYKLKQYAEAMKQLATQKNLSEKNIKAELSPIKSSFRKSNGTLDDSMKSQMKAVVEKSDSVSYMLEMTEDSSEIVTNIIRRAESLRSTTRDQSLPKKKRTKASSISCADTPSIKRNLSMEDEFRPDIASTPNSSVQDLNFERRDSPTKNSPGITPSHQYSANKIVKLNQDDFCTDSIELASDDCEIIEITKSFDKPDKNVEMVTSTSSSSSSISHGSHFDIESDVFTNLETDNNVPELDDDTESSEVQENRSTIRTFCRETENIKPVLPMYTDLEPTAEESFVPEDTGKGPTPYVTPANNFITIPKISGGEAMIGLSSDDEEMEKIRRTYEK